MLSPQRDRTTETAHRYDTSYVKGLKMLLDARNQAVAKNRPIGDFAIGIEDLHDAGLTDHHLRILASDNYLTFGIERGRPGRDHREFRWFTAIILTFPPKSCFLLTEEGVIWARDFLRQTSPGEVNGTPGSNGATLPAPSWHEDTDELWHLGKLVLRIHQDAYLQKPLLLGFHQRCWQAIIDNPFDDENPFDRAEKLREGVKKLNLRLKEHGHLLHFYVLACGQKAGWEIRALAGL